MSGTTGAESKTASAEKSVYDRLGGVFAIAAVVDHFSDAVVQNPIVGKTSKNPALREWHTNSLGRLPGLKFMRTLWVCNVAGGPLEYTATRPGKTTVGLEEAHGTYASHQPSSMKLPRSSGVRSISSRSRSARRMRFSARSRHTRTKSRQATQPPRRAKAGSAVAG